MLQVSTITYTCYPSYFITAVLRFIISSEFQFLVSNAVKTKSMQIEKPSETYKVGLNSVSNLLITFSLILP